MRGKADTLVRVATLRELAPNWRAFLAKVVRAVDIKRLRAHEQTGRPMGGAELLATLEQDLAKILRRQKPGPKGTPRS
jgi:putative transposase